MFLIINGVIVASSTQYIFFAEECLHIVLFLYQICWHVGRYAKHVQLLLCSIFLIILSIFLDSKKMGEFGGQNAHSTLNTDCESGG